jgi:hypothetical protein
MIAVAGQIFQPLVASLFCVHTPRIIQIVTGRNYICAPIKTKRAKGYFVGFELKTEVSIATLRSSRNPIWLLILLKHVVRRCEHTLEIRTRFNPSPARLSGG